MDPIMGIAIYVILWWISLFMVLPFGVRSVSETKGENTVGHDAGAPVKANIPIKLLAAAGVAAVLWVGVYVYLDMAYFSQFRGG